LPLPELELRPFGLSSCSLSLYRLQGVVTRMGELGTTLAVTSTPSMKYRFLEKPHGLTSNKTAFFTEKYCLLESKMFEVVFIWIQLEVMLWYWLECRPGWQLSSWICISWYSLIPCVKSVIRLSLTSPISRYFESLKEWNLFSQRLNNHCSRVWEFRCSLGTLLCMVLMTRTEGMLHLEGVSRQTFTWICSPSVNRHSALFSAPCLD
jgi:hypothetical protein